MKRSKARQKKKSTVKAEERDRLRGTKVPLSKLARMSDEDAAHYVMLSRRRDVP